MMTKMQYNMLFWFSIAGSIIFSSLGETVTGALFLICGAIYMVGKDISARLQVQK